MADPIVETTPEVRDLAVNEVSWPLDYPSGPIPVPDAASSLASTDLAKLSNAMRSGATMKPVTPTVGPGGFGASSSIQAGLMGPQVSVSQEVFTREATAVHPLLKFWFRAPLLTITLGYSALGIVGTGMLALSSEFLSARMFVALGQLVIGLWASGFLAMLCYGFYSFVKFTPPARN